MNVVIQAIAGKRLREREALSAELRRQGAAVEAVESLPREPCRVTFLRALRSPADSSGYVIRLEDDAWPAPDFAGRLALLLARATFSLLMLYSNRSRVLDAHLSGLEMIRLPYSEASMSVGIAFAAGLVEPFAAWLPEWEADNQQHRAAQDLAIAAFCRKERLTIRAAVPSLVQHRDRESYLGHPCGRRQSRTYLLAYGEVPPC